MRANLTGKLHLKQNKTRMRQCSTTTTGTVTYCRRLLTGLTDCSVSAELLAPTYSVCITAQKASSRSFFNTRWSLKHRHERRRATGIPSTTALFLIMFWSCSDVYQHALIVAWLFLVPNYTRVFPLIQLWFFRGLDTEKWCQHWTWPFLTGRTTRTWNL